MNTLQIAKILSQNKITKNCFKGISAADQINRHETYPYALVANTDKHNDRGTHWVAFYVKNFDTVEYFDSFGQKPNKEITKFLSQFKNILTNNVKLQSIFDTSCGAHVIFFIVKRCLGVDFNNIFAQLNHPYADTMVKLFVYKLHV